jgi:phenylacetate-coenzyme A ligase PaaK-like adenylate-forming protein
VCRTTFRSTASSWPKLASPHYQLVVDRSSTFLDVLVEASAEVLGSPERLVQLERRPNYEVRSALGIACRVQLVGPKQIQRGEGKALGIVDKRRL